TSSTSTSSTSTSSTSTSTSGSGSSNQSPPGAAVTGYTLYLPGDGTRDFSQSGAPYISGNLVIVNSEQVNALDGRGNFYSKGSIDVEGKSVSGGGTSKNVALFANGDVYLVTKGDSSFKGLVYTYGDFNSEIKQMNSSFVIQGSLIVAGKDPNTDPNGAYWDPGILNINQGNVDIKFDDSILNVLTYNQQGGSGYGFVIVSWHEF
ncbi:MAG: hypothetical protein ABRQ39_29870, partial [Candidatus Eremiobacterota bacterium]